MNVYIDLHLLSRFWDVYILTCRSVFDFILNMFPLESKELQE